MIYPTIHTNGTSKEHLTESLAKAANALRESLKALEDTFPHARDYYVQGTGAFQEAVKEHNTRVSKVRSVLEEIGEIWENI